MKETDGVVSIVKVSGVELICFWLINVPFRVKSVVCLLEL